MPRPTPPMRAARDQSTRMVEMLGELVGHESPPGSLRHLTRCADLLSRWGEEVLGRPARRVVRDGSPHLLWEADDQQILLLGHFDTVWPAGTTADWPFSVNGTIATGPGVCDMKAGIVQMFTALKLMASTARVGMLLTCDEETGSATSRDLIVDQARRSGTVLVGEPSTPDGRLKIARKGGALYRLTVDGRAAHAGVEPHLGVNATVEAAHQVLVLRAMNDPAAGTTVTPTVISAGTTTNTVPAAASLAVDVRAWTDAELDRIDRAIRTLQPHLSDATLSVRQEVGRYPMAPQRAMGLFQQARAAARDLGLPPPGGARAAGVSDANLTAALGVPTLDGLGGVGGGSHARSEYVDISQMPDRAALLARLVDRILAAAPSTAPSGVSRSPSIRSIA
ncbi:M20 family metallopeptidase [Solwaraspora sp. WMMD406]|uniref:M20 family metallopeptidase n=1 Tax=Solwaraspora sp. WMMD406 TaxID=3016095 RepID=UPI00241681C2|nr:M20 family metallopeptidase [Solwaraspora sp. WMMD406]MDG4763498.1 M20 family metallopeptidase [Solwaraspora sp. WMMD406]